MTTALAFSSLSISRSRRAAFDRAIAIARARGAELTAVHAVPADQRFNARASARIALVAILVVPEPPAGAASDGDALARSLAA